MGGYSASQQDEIIRDYFGPPPDKENPRCPHCGDVLEVEPEYQPSHRLRLRVRCRPCRSRFSWLQPKTAQPWKLLHLQYFMERYRLHQTIRCPLDDCYVSYLEFNDGVVEFRCPYCNHRGRVPLGAGRDTDPPFPLNRDPASETDE